jgi:iron(III) transport system permease protein
MAKLRKKIFQGYNYSQLPSYLTLLTIILVFLFFLVIPVFSIVSKSLYTKESGFSFQYMSLLFQNSLYMKGIRNSLLIGVVTTLFSLALSLPLALTNARLNYKGKALLSGLLLVPMVMPPFVGAIGIHRFFARFGSVNIFLLEKGLISTPIDWLSPEYYLFLVSFIESLHLYPILYLNLVAALSNLDPSLEEAAATMGDNRFTRFKKITWPLILPGFFSGSILVFIWALTDLGTPLLVGFHETIPVHIFNLVTNVDQNPVGHSLVLLVVCITTFIFLFSKFISSRINYEMLGRGHSTPNVSNAKWYEYFSIYFFSLFVIFLALIPHLTVLVTSFGDNWFMTVLPEKLTLNHYSMVFSESLSLTGVKNSFFLSTMATGVNVVLGVAIAYIVTRKLIPFANLLDSLVMVPLALPGIILAFGYVVTYTGTFLDPLENPIPLLIIAYSIRRLPYMVRAASAGLQQTSASLEEASLLFGANKFQTILKITIPLLMANLIAGALMSFSYSMLDVSDSLILAMKDQFYPITKAIYVFYLEQGNGEFIASALGMVAMLILTLSILGVTRILGNKMGELFKA